MSLDSFLASREALAKRAEQDIAELKAGNELLRQAIARIDAGEAIENVLDYRELPNVGPKFPPPFPINLQFYAYTLKEPKVEKFPLTADQARAALIERGVGLRWKMYGRPVDFDQLIISPNGQDWWVKKTGKAGRISRWTLMYHTTFEDGSPVGHPRTVEGSNLTFKRPPPREQTKYQIQELGKRPKPAPRFLPWTGYMLTTYLRHQMSKSNSNHFTTALGITPLPGLRPGEEIRVVSIVENEKEPYEWYFRDQKGRKWGSWLVAKYLAKIDDPSQRAHSGKLQNLRPWNYSEAVAAMVRYGANAPYTTGNGIVLVVKKIVQVRADGAEGWYFLDSQDNQYTPDMVLHFKSVDGKECGVWE